MNSTKVQTLDQHYGSAESINMTLEPHFSYNESIWKIPKNMPTPNTEASFALYYMQPCTIHRSNTIRKTIERRDAA